MSIRHRADERLPDSNGPSAQTTIVAQTRQTSVARETHADKKVEPPIHFPGESTFRPARAETRVQEPNTAPFSDVAESRESRSQSPSWLKPGYNGELLRSAATGARIEWQRPAGTWQAGCPCRFRQVCRFSTTAPARQAQDSFKTDFPVR